MLLQRRIGHALDDLELLARRIVVRNHLIDVQRHGHQAPITNRAHYFPCTRDTLHRQRLTQLTRKNAASCVGLVANIACREPPSALKLSAAASASSSVDFPVPFSPTKDVTRGCSSSVVRCRIAGIE